MIYTTGSKLAEQGGVARDDRHVALLVSGPDTEPGLVRRRVETAQIAPTILEAFGISPEELDAVQNEHTEPLHAE
ncbi:MAG: hypothetical protein JO299_18055 [Gammaproteobacteria bacterium]|nr:hypothetical protein [Gammaproteobacteria bacterium]